MTQQEEFEKWIIESNEIRVVPNFIRKDENGDYMDLSTSELWEAWQAAKAQAVPQWIPAGERLPPVGEQCLFYRPLAKNSGDNVIAVKTAMKIGQPCWSNTVPDGETPCNPSNGACHVTHWIQLPAAPEQNK